MGGVAAAIAVRGEGRYRIPLGFTSRIALNRRGKALFGQGEDLVDDTAKLLGHLAAAACGERPRDLAVVPEAEEILCAAPSRFAAPQDIAISSPVAGGWQQKLAGHCVAYLSTYSSSGGYASSKSRFYLYPNGSFGGGSSSSLSIDTGGAFGSSASDSGNQAGRWQAVARGDGAVLSLQYPDGSSAEYSLSTNEKGHTLLDGERWFVVSYQECNDL